MDDLRIELAPKALEVVTLLHQAHQWFPEMVTPPEQEIRKGVAHGEYYLAFIPRGTLTPELVGFIRVQRGWDGVILLQELGVMEKYRRKGVAKKLLHKGCKIYPIQVCVSRYNQDAQAFFKSQGFYVSGNVLFPKPEGLIMYRHSSMADSTGYL